jgi:hypothetical protein
MKKIIFLLLCLTACNGNNADLKEFYNGEILFNDDQFKVSAAAQHQDPSVPVLPGNDLEDVCFLGQFKVIARKDDKQATVSIYDLQDTLVNEFNGHTPEALHLIAPECLFQVNNHSFGIYDLTKDEVVLFDNDKRNNWRINKTIELLPETRGLTSVEYQTDGKFIATSINTIEGKVLRFRLLPQQSTLKPYGIIPKSDQYNKYVSGMKFRSTCTYNSSTKSIFIAHYYTDLLESYDSDGRRKFIIHGPEKTKPHFKVKNVGKNQVFISTKETKRAYLSLTTDNNYLYALYDGYKNSKIYIFTLDGKPYRKIISALQLRKIRMDQKTGRLFAIASNQFGQTSLVYYETKTIK